MTRLSVIIPGYNTPEKWWRRCLYSVRQACGPDDEIICIDDGSAKHPVFLDQIAAEDPRVKPIFLEKNVGQAAARNKALDAANGEWIAFVDSDDKVLPDVYDRCFGASNIVTSDIVLFGVRVVWTDEGLYKDDVPSSCAHQLLTIDDVGSLYDDCLFEYPCNRLYRRAFLDSHGIRFDAGVCPGEDTIFNQKCLLADARYSFVSKVGYVYYRFYTSSLSRYQPLYIKSHILLSENWRRIKEKLACGRLDVPKFDELTEEEILKLGIENDWRYDSPVSYYERLKRHGIVLFVRNVIAQVIRKHFYWRLFRRWKIKLMFPNVQEIA